jgi:hypothetical protein
LSIAAEWNDNRSLSVLDVYRSADLYEPVTRTL